MQESLAGLVILQFPCELLSALVAGRWAAAASPFAPWRGAYGVRLAAAAATAALVAYFPTDAASLARHPAAFLALAAVGLATSFSSTLMFTALGSFYNRVSDPDMGGAYLTMLNTIANIGITLPKLAVFALMDAQSFNACECAAPHRAPPAATHRCATHFPSAAAAACDCTEVRAEGARALSRSAQWPQHAPAAALIRGLARCRDAETGVLLHEARCPRNYQASQQPNTCTEAGGACVAMRDGFYATNALLVALGAALFLHFRRALPALERLPLEAWRVKALHRHA